VFIGFFRHRGGYPDLFNLGSGTLLPEPSRWLSDEFRKPDQVVRGATEDEQPVHFLQAPQLDLAKRPVCFSHPKPFSISHRRLRLIA
jgi:hypothetical protein